MAEMAIRLRRVLVVASIAGAAACSSHVDAGDQRSDADAGVMMLAPDAGKLAGTGGAMHDPTAAPDAGRVRAADAGLHTADAGGGSARLDAAVEADAAAPDDAGPAISDGPPEVRFVGRIDRGDPAGPRFAWSGTGLVARFMSTSIAVDLAGGQEYTLLLDGELQDKFVPGNGSTLIKSGLSSGPHVIELYRRTEANQGDAQFRGFTFDASGMLLPPTLAPPRRIEVIGDSITCGYGDEGADQSCKFTPQTENHYMTYAAIAARNVGAELSTIAWSGKGVVCNYGDDAQSCTDPFPPYYDRALPSHADSSWDFGMFQPQVVIINLGTNDFSTDQDPSESEFTDAYRDFLLHIRSKNPDALILCTCGPLLSGTELDKVRAYIDSAITATGDDAIASFDIPPQDFADGLGCDYHPNLKTHQKMADLVTAELKTRLGW
jgi:lysophospholipase L1-like esterase